MVKVQNKETILHGDVEQHGQIAHGEWYLRSHRRRDVYDSSDQDVNIRTEFKEVISSLSAGAVAGAVAKTTIAPLDRTKIIFQTSNRQFSVKGAVGVLRQTYLENGFLGLFRGNSATMARIIPYASLQFTAHEQFKQLLRQDNYNKKGPLPPVRRFLAGSLAGITAALFTYPLDMIRARLAITQKNRYTGLMNIVTKIYREEGFTAYYRGLFPTLMGIMPYAGISFFTYETLKKLYSDIFHERKLNPLHRLSFGACAGLFGQSATYPLDIIRRRMQTDGISSASRPEYRKMWSTAKYVYATEGLRKGLYKGLSMNWVKGPIAVGISFTTFDLLHGFFQRHYIHTEAG